VQRWSECNSGMQQWWRVECSSGRVKDKENQFRFFEFEENLNGPHYENFVK